MTTKWNDFEISNEYSGSKCALWDNDSYDRHNVITVKNLKTGDKFSFDYWTSRAKPDITEESELMDALDCYFTDASYGENDFDDYCREMGYDVPDNIYQSWKACRNARRNVERCIGINWSDVADMIRDSLD